MSLLFLAAATALTAYGQISAGKAENEAAKRDAYNLETDRIMSQAQAQQQSNRRLELYRSNMSSNIAQFAASGRDIGADRSVAAFLEKQKEVAASDVSDIQRMGRLQASKLRMQSTTAIMEGVAAETAGYIAGYTTIASGLYKASMAMAPSGGGGSSAATSGRGGGGGK